MKVGTKSVLFGVHCFAIHPFIVAWAWWMLYGFPWDPRLWFAFFLHDIGYLGKDNMDGPTGEEHPYVGAKIMGKLFGKDWYWFTLLHSRHLAKRLGMKTSRLAMADKLAIAIEPSWLYLPRARLSGEINDYLECAAKCDPFKHGLSEDAALCLRVMRVGGLTRSDRLWHVGIRGYMSVWVREHLEGEPDTTTQLDHSR